MENIVYNGKNFILFNDGNLYKFGTIYRDLSRYLKIENGRSGYKEYVYSGKINSSEPHALIQGVLDNLPFLKIKLFLLGSESDLIKYNYRYPNSIMDNIILYDNISLNNLKNIAFEYANENKSRKYIQFSPDEDIRNLYIMNSLKTDVQFNNLILDMPERLFVIVDKGTILSILLYLLPYTHFVAIVINPDFDLSDIQDQSDENISRIQLIRAYDFNTDNYYKELLDIVSVKGKDNDYIFIPYLLHLNK